MRTRLALLILCLTTLCLTTALHSRTASAQEQTVIDPPLAVMVIAEQARVMSGDTTASYVPQGTFLRLTRINANWRFSPDCGGWVHLRDLIEYDKALPELSRRITRDPSPAHYQLRGIYYISTEEWEKGLADFEHAYALGESAPNLHLNIGYCLERLGRYSDAYGEFSAILDVYPDDVDARIARGNILLMTQNAEGALADFSQAVIDAPDDADSHNLKGLALRVLNRNEEAIASFNEALRLNPEQADALCNRGFTYKQMGNETQAMKDYEEALKLAPNSASIRNDLAWALATSPTPSIRDPKRAVELSEAINEETDQSVSEYLDTMAAAYASIGRFEAAAEAAKLAAALLQAPELKAEVISRQKMYEQRKPYIEQVASKAGSTTKAGQTAQRAIRTETQNNPTKDLRNDKKKAASEESKDETKEEPKRGLLRNLRSK